MDYAVFDQRIILNLFSERMVLAVDGKGGEKDVNMKF